MVRRIAILASLLAAFAALSVIQAESYLLFHSLVESFGIVVAVAVFILAIGSRPFTDSDYIFVVGVALLHVAVVDLLHMLAYKGMGVFPGRGANLATQLWIGARFLDTAGLLAAPFFIDRKAPAGPLAAAFGGATALFLASVFLWRNFPACFVEGSGLTPFKIGSEYAICLLLCVAAFLTLRKRDRFEPRDLRLILLSIGMTVAAELCFILYSDPYGFPNMAGHLFKAAGVLALAVVILESGIRRPHTILFRNLADREEALRKAMGEVRSLQDILPICSGCKMIRDDEGYWKQVDVYISEHTQTLFSHGLCPDCVQRLYPGFDNAPTNPPGP